MLGGHGSFQNMKKSGLATRKRDVFNCAKPRVMGGLWCQGHCSSSSFGSSWLRPWAYIDAITRDVQYATFGEYAHMERILFVSIPRAVVHPGPWLALHSHAASERRAAAANVRRFVSQSQDQVPSFGRTTSRDYVAAAALLPCRAGRHLSVDRAHRSCANSGKLAQLLALVRSRNMNIADTSATGTKPAKAAAKS